MLHNEEYIYDLLKEIFLILDDGDQHLFGLYSLSVTHYYALHHLHTYPGITLSELSQHMLCDKSNVTRMVKNLEERGLVNRQQHETDGRRLRLFLTDTGTLLQARVHVAHKRFNGLRLQSLLPQLIETDAIGVLQTVHDTLSAELPIHCAVTMELLEGPQVAGVYPSPNAA